MIPEDTVILDREVCHLITNSSLSSPTAANCLDKPAPSLQGLNGSESLHSAVDIPLISCVSTMWRRIHLLLFQCRELVGCRGSQWCQRKQKTCAAFNYFQAAIQNVNVLNSLKHPETRYRYSNCGLYQNWTGRGNTGTLRAFVDGAKKTLILKASKTKRLSLTQAKVYFTSLNAFVIVEFSLLILNCSQLMNVF